MNFEKTLQNFIHESISSKIKSDRIFEMGQKFIVENEKEDGFLNFLTDYSKNEFSQPTKNLKLQFLGSEVLKTIYDVSLMKYKEIKYPDSIGKNSNPEKSKKSASQSDKESEDSSEKESLMEKSMENSNENESEKKKGKNQSTFKVPNSEYFPKVGKRVTEAGDENHKRFSTGEKDMKFNRFFNNMPKFSNFNKKAQKIPNKTAYIDSPEQNKQPCSPRLLRPPPEKLFEKPLSKAFTNPYCINWPKTILKYHYSINIEEKETQPPRLTTARFKFRKIKSQKSLPLKKGAMPTPEKTNDNQNNIIQTENNYITSNFLLSNNNRIIQTENNYSSPNLILSNNFNGTTMNYNSIPNSNFMNNDYINLMNNNFFEPTPKKNFLPNIKNSPLGKKNKKKKKKNEGEKDVDFFKIADSVRNIAKELYSTGDSDVFKKKNDNNNSPLPIYSTNFLTNAKTNNIFPHIYKGIGNSAGDYDIGKLVISPEKLHTSNN